ncbi:hypothetical protein ANOM_003100 [Aspergillus nomiae NRRL 13137]|uniref:Uncharacterized protein n=1 Tax=Aspergillus nomiae NRRL (strain ATCC 15546 / NRRL 13137 / CBS 260.88 / M93) TaxID=1509407 RepID=A0A0L1JB68_ASPN3|nr:uncharacterized protein ANOM_003100 [Aspergillus nomiae NRRL 13137]KNG88683.1 hypothetical protein ANOM_003100 [Aspergillus nomiae NRRL 13137]
MHQKEIQEQQPPPPCEFTNPCPAIDDEKANNPRRKVISHIFGRNKYATKRFPDHVWVHYCRQHYQRARYRVEWPVTQCELLMVVLGRMERWGGVSGWEVVLRKREVQRLKGEDGGGEEEVIAATTGAGGRHSGGCCKDERGDDGDESDPTTSLSSGSGSSPAFSELTPVQDHCGRRRKPTIVASPVPGWLLREVGRDKSFADLRDLVRRVREDMDSLRGRGVPARQIVFPDIELLPTFQSWVLAPVTKRRRVRRNAGRGKKGGNGKKGSRVNGKGAVKRVHG